MGIHPVYTMQHRGRNVVLFHPGIGAPLATALLEELIALGCRKFIVCGGAGVLDSALEMGTVLIITSAVRDEGTSYHYLPPAREVGASPSAIRALEETLTAREVPYQLVKTWTTDAFYRETVNKIALRRSEGCLTVEMEAAALFAVAQFRKVEIGQILYAGDDISGTSWTGRAWLQNTPIREKLIWLAAEASFKI